MKELEIYDRANAVNSRDDLVNFMEYMCKSISSGEISKLNSYEVVDGCINFTSGIDKWCAYRSIPFDEKPTWSLVAWIILAGAMND